MIETHFSYDLLPNADMKAYGDWVKKTVKTMLEQPGLVEFRAQRNVLGTPQIRATSAWQTLADWSRFIESGTWQTMQAEMRTYVGNIDVQIWGSSPLMPEPLRPGK